MVVSRDLRSRKDAARKTTHDTTPGCPRIGCASPLSGWSALRKSRACCVSFLILPMTVDLTLHAHSVEVYYGGYP
jgi:hypothetical protein